MGFPHSEISGSKVAKHLPEAYRSYAASFIVTMCQGIHHTPLIARVIAYAHLHSLLREWSYALRT